MNAGAQGRHATPQACTVDVRGLHHRYADGTEALRGLQCHIGAGEAVAVVGANGAGKSTFLLHLDGLLLPTAGEVRVGDLALRRDTRVQVQRRVGYVFQDADDQLFMPTVEDDVAFGPLNLGLPPEAARERVHEALARVGAAHLATRAPWRLSGGEKRAVALAGVLAMAPQVLVLDEPSAGLDPAARRRLMALLRGLPQTRIIATHDLDLALDVCTRVLVMHEGRIEADGAPAEVFRNTPLLQRCHLEPPLAWQGAAK
jgi:cobalt/nickel transport system ATP-binding protein